MTEPAPKYQTSGKVYLELHSRDEKGFSYPVEPEEFKPEEYISLFTAFAKQNNWTVVKAEAKDRPFITFTVGSDIHVPEVYRVCSDGHILGRYKEIVVTVYYNL